MCLRSIKTGVPAPGLILSLLLSGAVQAAGPGSGAGGISGTGIGSAAGRGVVAAPAAGPAAAKALRPARLTTPAPGSYRLPVIQAGPAGTVLDSSGRSMPLQHYTRDRITLLNFMYTYCSDPVGCPQLYSTLHGLRERLLAQPALARRVRFVSISFDPANDTPEAMRLYGGALGAADSPLRWHFLTSRSVGELQPILSDLGQATSVQLDAQGKPTRLYYHLVKLFLLDQHGQVREIYSPAFLEPDLIYNDIRTLLLESERGAVAASLRRP
ncbi:SCO family protein [Oxalobacteraceae bacterium]|nr:SCO family protein [Oxalobacteraceae bacterium]